MEEPKKSDGHPGFRLLIVAIIVSLGGSFHFGYQLTLTNPCQDSFLKYLGDSIHQHYRLDLDLKSLDAIWSGIISIFFIGAILGSLSLRCVAERMGRRSGLILVYVFNLIGALLSILSKFILSFEVYTISRLSLGFSLGLSIGLAVLFLTECSPKHCRGAVGMITGIMLQMGTVVGAIVAMPQILGTYDHWWLIYSIEVILFLLVLLSFPFVPESPAHLIRCGSEDAARHSIQFYHACSPSDTDFQMREIKETLKLNTKSVGMIAIWRSNSPKINRRGVLIGCVVAFVMAFSGIAVINAFAVEIFRGAHLSHFNASLANVGLSVISMVSCFFSSFIIERFGRRRLLLITCSTILFVNISIFGLMWTYDKFGYNWIGLVLIAAISIFMFVFATGPGPLCFFLSAEIVHPSARSTAQSWTSFVQMSSRAFLLAVFLPLRNTIGASWSYLLLFVGPVFISIVFLYFWLPETRNRNLQEIEKELEKLPSLRSCFREIPRWRPQPKLASSKLSGVYLTSSVSTYENGFSS